MRKEFGDSSSESPLFEASMKVWVSADYEGRQGFKFFFLVEKQGRKNTEKSQAVWGGVTFTKIYIYMIYTHIYLYIYISIFTEEGRQYGPMVMKLRQESFLF